MGELDGAWSVERVSGALPPMMGVQKRIAGTRGETKLGRLPGVPFDVEGLTLRYRSPLSGFVDHLEPEGDVYRGRTTFQGRELGRFILRRAGTRLDEEGATMSSQQLKEQLVKHIDEGVAMEQNVLRMLDSMISTTGDPEIKEHLEHHRTETERHADLLRQRLEAHGASPSTVREAGGIFAALMKGVVDMARGEKAGRNARDGYATEHMEIASYELLERIAQRAGDEDTADVARRNRADEQAMAEKIAANWDKFAELSLAEEGITV